MTLGTSIFLSTIVVSLVLLHGMTKERWNWKKIITRTFLSLLSLAIIGALVAAGMWGLKIYQKRAVAQTEYYDIKLSHTQSDIMFIKGAPDVKKEHLWTYNTIYIHVAFQNNNIRAIMYVGKGSYSSEICGLDIGDSYGEVIDKFGSPSSMSNSEDQLEKILSFEKYNVIFGFSKNRVKMLGIYNKEFGDIKYNIQSIEK